MEEIAGGKGKKRVWQSNRADGGSGERIGSNEIARQGGVQTKDRGDRSQVVGTTTN